MNRREISMQPGIEGKDIQTPEDRKKMLVDKVKLLGRDVDILFNLYEKERLDKESLTNILDSVQKEMGDLSYSINLARKNTK